MMRLMLKKKTNQPLMLVLLMLFLLLLLCFLRVMQMISGDFEAQVCRAYVAGYKYYKETDYAHGNAKLSQRLMLYSIGFSDLRCVLFYYVHEYMNNIHLIHQG